MRTLNISQSLLMQALEAELKRQSVGVANINVLMLQGVVKTGEAFEIESLQIQYEPKATVNTYASNPKMRLASVDGVAL